MNTQDDGGIPHIDVPIINRYEGMVIAYLKSENGGCCYVGLHPEILQVLDRVGSYRVAEIFCLKVLDGLCKHGVKYMDEVKFEWPDDMVNNVGKVGDLSDWFLPKAPRTFNYEQEVKKAISELSYLDTIMAQWMVSGIDLEVDSKVKHGIDVLLALDVFFSRISHH